MNQHDSPSVRAQILFRRTYARPLDDEGTVFETFEQAIDRVVGHQRWLWERALGDALAADQSAELEELRALMLGRRAMVSGRVLWLGGTEVVRRRGASAFNCSYADVRTVHDVVDAFWLLLQGTGFGFRPINGSLSGFTRKIEVQVVRSTRARADGPTENRESYDPASKTWTIAVGDSAEAWAKSVGKIVAGKFPARKLVLDLSAIRPAGSRLKGYGWICQGDALLANALEAICGVMNRRVGKLLTKMDILDIVNWLGTVLSNRRSAQIALVDYGDPEWRDFATRKYKGFDSGPDWYRGQSNNSLIFERRPSKRQLRDLFDLMVENGGSEPGFINAEASRRRAPWWRGTNPCVTSDTWVMTDAGPRMAGDLVGVPFRAIVDGVAHDSTGDGFFPTGEKEVFRVETDRGYSFTCTADHQILQVVRDRAVGRDVRRWAKLSDLSVGDHVSLHNHRGLPSWGGPGTFASGWLLGSLLGDGVFTETGRGISTARLSYWGETKEAMLGVAREYLADSVRARSDAGRANPAAATAVAQDRVNLSSVGLRALAESFGVTPDKAIERRAEETSSDFHAGFLSGWFDADGSVVGDRRKGISVRLSSVSPENLSVAQRMLARLGIASTIYRDRQAAGPKSMPDGKGGQAEYECQALHELVVARDNLQVFEERVGFRDPKKSERLRGLLGSYEKAPYRDRFSAKIVSISPVGVRPVFDCTIPTASQFDGNGVALHNCGEILLPDMGFCNLVEVGLNKFKGDDPGLHRAAYLIARANYRQTLVDLRDGVLQDAWHQQNEYLRLCGVGLTGIAQRPDLTPYDYRQIRNSVVSGAYSMADELGMERPKAITTCKPSGTLSKAIFDSTEGAHKPKGRHIFNTVSFSRYDPLVPRMVDAGYAVRDHPNDKGSVLAVLPVEYPDVPLDHWNGFEVDREPAVEQMRRYRGLMRDYVDHNVSITVSYDESEAKAIVDAMAAHWDDYVACSFLFRDDPTKTAEDLGYAYMPQRVVTPEEYHAYASTLLPVDLDSAADAGTFEVDAGSECPGGACPVK